MTALEATPAWKQITQPQRYDILGANGIRVAAGDRRGDDRGSPRHAPAHQAE